MDFIYKTIEATVPITAVTSFHSQKPWITRTILDAINTCTAAYNLGLQSRNMDNYKAAAYNVRRADASLANELNNFYAQFEVIGSQQAKTAEAEVNGWVGAPFHTNHPFFR